MLVGEAGIIGTGFIVVPWLSCRRVKLSVVADGPGPILNSERAKWNEETDVIFQMSLPMPLVGAAMALGSIDSFLSEMNQVFTKETQLSF